MLSGSCAVLRPLTGGVTGVQLMFFLLVPAGRVFGRGFGFVLGNVAMFASAALTGGGGPWLPFQMLGRRLGRHVRRLPAAGARPGRARRCSPATALVAGIAYGFVLNLWFWPFGTTGTGAGARRHVRSGRAVLDNLRRWIAFSTSTSLGFDIPRGLATALALLLVGRPVLLALRRAARRAAFDAVARVRALR